MGDFMKMVIGILVSVLLTSQTFAWDSRPTLRRVLDYKTHKVICVAESNQVTVDTVSRQGTQRKSKRGRFFDNSIIESWVAYARTEPVHRYMHVRESIPNVRFEADGLLIVWSAGHTLMRNGNYSFLLGELVEDLCGPANE
jgi:hypothetical protein